MLEATVRQQYIPSLCGFNPRAYDSYWNRRKEPWKFLNDVGIDAICEFIMNGFSPMYIKGQLSVPLGTISAWINADDERKTKYDEAFAVMADNAMYEARDLLDDAPLLNEAISKAGKQAEHRRHMAKGFGAKRWGAKISVDQNTTATVHYNFNIALDDKQKAQIIEGESRRIGPEPSQVLDINQLIGSGVGAVSLGIGTKESMTYEEAKAQEEYGYATGKASNEKTKG
jgi:hypothetical protein